VLTALGLSYTVTDLTDCISLGWAGLGRLLGYTHDTPCWLWTLSMMVSHSHDNQRNTSVPVERCTALPTAGDQLTYCDLELRAAISYL